jgi:hypothetical protein
VLEEFALPSQMNVLQYVNELLFSGLAEKEMAILQLVS